MARNGGFVRALGFWMAGLLSLCLLVSLSVPTVVYAGTVPDLGTGESMDILSSGDVMQNNKGTIMKNEGTVTSNEGTIIDNFGTVDSNKGTINSNYEQGKVEHNLSGGQVHNNDGTVNNNDGIITSNYKTVERNGSGAVIHGNWGTVTENHGLVVQSEGGTITRNFGTVMNYQGGIVETNEQSGTVFNYDGTVTNNTGKHYYQVYISIDHVQVSYGNGFQFTKVEGIDQAFLSQSEAGAYPYIWLEQSATGTITLKPDDGYEIQNITVGGIIQRATKNADDSWTLTLSGLTENRGIRILADENAKTKDPDNQNNNSGIEDLGISQAVIELTVSDDQQDEQQTDLNPFMAAWYDQAASGRHGGGTGTQNQEDVAEEKEYFDHIFYADTYPDLKAAFDYNFDLLWQHWLNFGKAEGRKARFVKGGKSRIVQYPPTVGTVPLTPANSGND